jgi:hypothetical protein
MHPPQEDQLSTAVDTVLIEHLAHYNQHRPHRAFTQQAPLASMVELDPKR